MKEDDWKETLYYLSVDVFLNGVDIQTYFGELGGDECSKIRGFCSSYLCDV